MQNLIVLLLAMLASGAIGFYVARERYGRGHSKTQGLGIRRVQRRAREAETQAAKLKFERDRLHRARR